MVGVIIDYGVCLDLATLIGIESLQTAYESLKEIFDTASTIMPKNEKGYLRHLDCAVINHLHEIVDQIDDLPKIDTVKGIFIEGDPVYPDAGFRKKTHIQICVRNPECIKGVFRVKPEFLIGS